MSNPESSDEQNDFKGYSLRHMLVSDGDSCAWVEVWVKDKGDDGETSDESTNAPPAGPIFNTDHCIYE